MAELTPEQRSHLLEGTFALPERRAYPLPDASHARNALARAAQHGTPDEKQRVRAAVHSRFPEIGKEGHVSDTQKTGSLAGAGAGALLGAGTGALAAGKGNRGRGALLGGVAGGAGGAVVGHLLKPTATRQIAEAVRDLTAEGIVVKNPHVTVARGILLGTAGGATGLGAGTVAGLGTRVFKKREEPALSGKIPGTIKQSSFAPFEELYKEADVAELLPRCPVVLEALSKIASKGVGSRMSLEGTVKLATARRLDVVQVMPTQYGYLVKWAAAPNGLQPQQQELSVPQAQQALPPEMLRTADEQGVATVTGVEAEPDPLEEHPQSTEGFGLYKVYELGTGKEQVGFVIPNLFDPRSGQPTPTKLFVNGTAFCMQPDIAGVLIGVSYNLPAGPSEPRGMGVFYKTDSKGIIATIPFNVMTSVTVEGRQYYSAQTPEGVEVQIVPSAGLQRPVVASPGEIAVPIDYSWLPLDNQIQLQGAQADPMRQAKQASVATRAIIRAWTDGNGSVQGASLSGPVFAKVGSGVRDPADALFMLAAAGLPQNLALAVMDKAASTGQPQELYGLCVLDPEPAIMKEALADAMADLAIAARYIPEAPCLLKEAMAIELCKEAKTLVGPDSLDTLLSIGFINQENVRDFVDSIPELEETASKLASLVFATQLGLQSVPKEAAVRAMNSLENVLGGLRALRTHRL